MNPYLMAVPTAIILTACAKGANCDEQEYQFKALNSVNDATYYDGDGNFIAKASPILGPRSNHRKTLEVAGQVDSSVEAGWLVTRIESWNCGNESRFVSKTMQDRPDWMDEGYPQ